MSTLERRTMERFPLKLEVNLSAEDKKGTSAVLKFRTENVCAGGAYLMSGNTLPVGTGVNVDLVLPLGKFENMAGKSSQIKVTGSIIRSSEDGMAILFNEKYQLFSS